MTQKPDLETFMALAKARGIVLDEARARAALPAAHWVRECVDRVEAVLEGKDRDA